MATIIVIYQQCGIYDGSGTIIIFFNVCGPHCAEWALHLTQNGPILARVQRGIPNTPKARKKTRRTSAWALPRRCGALRPRSYTLRSKISSRVSLSISSGFFVLPSPFPFLSMDSIPCASFSHLMIWLNQRRYVISSLYAFWLIAICWCLMYVLWALNMHVRCMLQCLELRRNIDETNDVTNLFDVGISYVIGNDKQTQQLSQSRFFNHWCLEPKPKSLEASP